MATKNLTDGSVSGSLFKLTAPMMVGISSNILVSMLEIGFIGQLGTREVAAITFTFPIVMILSSIALGIGIGTSSVIARGVGAGDTDSARRIATHSILMVLLLMSVLSLLGWLTVQPVFTALGAGNELLPLIHGYLNVYYPSVVLFTTTMVASNVMRANGSANIPGVVMTLGALLNLVLDPILIFGWFGFPRWELAGAAAANAISRVVTTAVLLYYLRRSDFVATRAIFAKFLDSSRRILQVGLPAIATQLIGPVSATVITRLLAGHGEAVVAGFGVATRIESVAVMLLFALSASIGPFVGQNWGANRPDRVRVGLRLVYQFCLLWGLLAAIPLALVGDTIASWVDDDPRVVATAAFYLAVVPWSHGLWGVLMMASASFNALGKPVPSTIMSFARMFILYVPLALLFDNLFGHTGIFIAAGMTNCAMGALAYWWFKTAFFSNKVAAAPGVSS